MIVCEAKPVDNPLLIEALKYAALGWQVMPLHHVEEGRCSCGNANCKSAGKHPRTARGLKDATTDEAVLRRWWSRWPQANVGVRTGRESGIWMLGPDGAAGIEALAEMVRRYGGLPETPKSQTGSGGRHHIFRWPDDGNITNRRNHRGEPIDVRGADGLFVAPPSHNCNGSYAWEIHPSDCEPADAPKWLLAWCRADEKRANGSRFVMQASGIMSIMDRALKYLEKIPPAISGQGGHDQTMEAARVLAWGFDLGAETAYQLLATHYNPRCQPPWSEKELRHKCTDADSKPFGKPRGWLLQEQNGRHDTKSNALKKSEHSPKENKPSVITWEPPLPLSESCRGPSFPLACLPDWLAVWVHAEATATQTPPDLAAMLALAQAGSALSHKFRICVRDGWVEPTNLFTVTALLSGERKSAVFRDVMAPTYEYEAEYRAEMAPLIAAAKAERAVLEAREKHLAAKAAKQEDKVERELLLHEAKEAARELAKHVIPEEPQLICDDVTPETLAKLLVRQGGKILLAGPEGTAFEIARGRYSEGANFDVFLKGHAGDPLRTNRISRERELCDNPALSAGLAVQPDVIRGLASEATMRTRGFLARWLYSIPESMVGTRQIAPQAVPHTIADVFRENMIELWRLPGSVDESGKPAPHWLRFGKEADEVMRQFEAWLEPLLAPGKELSLLAGWANKLAGAVTRIAGILHVAAAIGEKGRWQMPIERSLVESAIQLGKDYLLPHAKIAFGMMGADEKLEKARQVWQNIHRYCADSAHSADAPPSLTRRDIHSQNRRQFVTAKELDPVLEVLMDRGYLHAVPGSGEAGRGHASPRYLINPLALQGARE